MSNQAKWIIFVVSAVLGVIALIYAIIYVSVGIHSLPAFVPGHETGVLGHYHKRALLCGVIGVVLLAIAALVAISARRSATQGAVGSGSTSESSRTTTEQA